MNQIPFVRIPFQLKRYTHVDLKTSAHCSCIEPEVSSKVLGSKGKHIAFAPPGVNLRSNLIMERTLKNLYSKQLIFISGYIHRLRYSGYTSVQSAEHMLIFHQRCKLFEIWGDFLSLDP